MPPESFKSAWRKEWPALAACMAMPAISNGAFVTCFALWVVPWVSEFRASRGAIMLGFTVGNLVMGAASPLVGYLLGRIPVRLMLSLGALTLGGGLVLASVAPSIWEILALYATVMAFGAAFTGVLPAQSVAVGLMPKNAGLVSGLIMLSMSAGGIVMPILAASPIERLGWRISLLIVGAVVVVTLAPLSWFVLKGYGGRPVHGTASAELSPIAGRLGMRSLLGSPAFWVPLCAAVSVMFVVGTVSPNSVVIAKDSGVHLNIANYLVPLIAMGGAIGSLGLGWVADRADCRLIFVATAAVVAASLLMLLVGRPSLVAIGFAFAVAGFAGGGVFPLLGVMVVRSFGASAFPRIMGLMMPVIVVAMGVAPSIAGWSRDETGSYAMAFIYCACLVAAAGLLVLLVRISPAKPLEAAMNAPA